MEKGADLPDEFEVVGLAAGSRWRELANQVSDWKPEYVAIGDEQLDIESRTLLLRKRRPASMMPTPRARF